MPDNSYPEIQTPTPGRVVLYAPVLELDAVAATVEQGFDEVLRKQGYLPAVVVRHDGGGQVRLSVHGMRGAYTSRYSESAPGVPASGSWCYPAIVRDTTIAVPPANERTA